MTRPAHLHGTVRLDGPVATVAAVPHLLGFRPTESLVGLALRGERDRVHFTMRLDLVPRDHDEQVARVTAEHLHRAQADAAMLVVVTEDDDDAGDLPRADLVAAVQQQLRVPLVDAMLLRRGRVWSYLCPGPCCPADGTPLSEAGPTSLALAAASALTGRAVLGDRAALVATVDPLGGIAAVSLRQAADRELEQRRRLGPRRHARSARNLLLAALGRYAEPPARLTHDELARLVVATHDVAFRDEVLRRYVRDPDLVGRLLHDLVRAAQPPHDAPACTLFAWAAYDRGEGTLVDAALSRALATDADYTLARLLRAALDGQLPPSELRAMALDAWRVRTG